jgi:hypothetical protein
MNAVLLPTGLKTWDIESAPPISTPLGKIEHAEDGKFHITPGDGSPILDIDPGPYATVEAAMSAIGGALGGTCERYRT